MCSILADVHKWEVGSGSCFFFSCSTDFYISFLTSLLNTWRIHVLPIWLWEAKPNPPSCSSLMLHCSLLVRWTCSTFALSNFGGHLGAMKEPGKIAETPLASTRPLPFLLWNILALDQCGGYVESVGSHPVWSGGSAAHVCLQIWAAEA